MDATLDPATGSRQLEGLATACSVSPHPRGAGVLAVSQLHIAAACPWLQEL